MQVEILPLAGIAVIQVFLLYIRRYEIWTVLS